jgi:Fe-S-cluster containining protein
MGKSDMSNCCLRTQCIQCCKQTNMLLTNRDIETITTLGYDRTYFVERRNGWLQLKNSQGRCIFHTGEICGIYDHRPEGCMLYPVVYDNDTHCAILDSECPQQHMFSLEKHNVHKLIMLIATLRRERSQRKNTPPYKKKTT